MASAAKKTKVVVTFPDGKQQTFETEADLTEMTITKMKAKKNNQPMSQDIHLANVDTVYRKPVKIQTPPYLWRATPDACNSWANPAKGLGRELTKFGVQRKNSKGAPELALRALFLPTRGKTADAVMDGNDRSALFTFVENGGVNGLLLIRRAAPELPRTKNVNGKEVKVRGLGEVRAVVHNDLLCYDWPDSRTGGNRIPVCTESDCLSIRGTNQASSKCVNHRRILKYGMYEVQHYNRETGVRALFSTQFTFSEEYGATEERNASLFGRAVNRSLTNGKGGGWAQYKAELGSDPVRTTTYKRVFDKPEDCERHLALLQTSRLITKMADAKLLIKYERDGQQRTKKREFRIINKEVSLAYKNEKELEKFLRDECVIVLTCTPATALDLPLPPEMGRRITLTDKTPGENEGSLYMESDQNVNYSGEKEKSQSCSGRSVLVSPKGEAALMGYQRQMNTALTGNPLLIVGNDRLHKTEQIVNFSNYLGHIFKVDNPFTKTDYICLNKLIITDLLLGEWALVRGFSTHFFKVDFTLTQV